MRVTLAGPDDLDFWFLDDEHGNSFQVVNRREDVPRVAALFGWTRNQATEDAFEEAFCWLMDHIGDEIDAPEDVAAYFQQLYEEQRE